MQNWILSECKPGLVSVIIPTYNRASLLKEAVMSVFEQTYRPVECIVVDDGSSDNSADVMAELQKLQGTDFTLKYIVQQNAGSQVARNRGTMESTGEFIQYLDSDDLLYPEKIERQVEFLDSLPECDGVYGDWQVGSKEKNTKVKGYKSDDMITQFLTQKCIANFSFLMRKKVVKEIGEWDITIKRNQEIDFHLRGVLAGGHFEYEPVLGGLWRTHAGDRIGNSTQFTSAINFYHKWEKLLKDKKLWTEKISKGISNNYIWFLNEYPNSSNLELRKLLLEIKRLNPQHPIFNSKKFKMIRFFAGTEMAIDAWIKIYKRKNKHG